jgi:large conductance mechanosensitive channel
MLKEFKEFAVKGNVMDMAIGIIIGAAFTSVVKSMVNDILMPFIGFFTGGLDFTNVFTVLGDGSYATLAAAQEAGAATVNWGLFINNLISFVIVAWVVFFLIKGMNKMKREEEATPEAPAEPPKNEVLLGEIRDLLAKSS